MILANKIKIYERTLLFDSRGSFLKILTGTEDFLPKHTGEIYITTAKYQEMKGGHFHSLANEWFCLIKGECVLKLIDVETLEKMEITLSGDNPLTIYIPNNVAHAFFNTSNDPSSEFILIAYSDEYYNPIDTILYDFNSK